MTRVLLFPSGSPVEGPEASPAPADEYLARGTVLEEPYLDVNGRAIFTAIGPHGVRIDEGSAFPSERADVLARLWQSVDRAAGGR